ncbi:nuclear transport factor 2 family protein [Angustibacter aerolatus]
MATVDELMRATLLEVFGERDDARRRAAVERVYAPDVVFSDPDEVVTGHDALDAKAKRLLDDAPGFVFRAEGPALVNHELGHQSWAFGPPDGDPVVRGVDVALVADGRITRLYTMLLTD